MVAEDEPPPFNHEWWLAERVASRVPSHHTISAVRKLGEDEALALLNANRLISTLGAQAAYQRCVTLLDALAQRIEKAGERGALTGGDALAIPETICSLWAALTSLADASHAIVADYSSEPSVLSELQQVLDAAQESDSWAKLSTATTRAAGVFALAPDEEVMWTPPASESSHNLRQLAHEAVEVAQSIELKQFVMLQDEIRDASLLLRRTTVEVLSGEPLLIHSPPAEGGPPKMTPHQLRIDLVGPVIRATQIATERHDESPHRPPRAGGTAPEPGTATELAAVLEPPSGGGGTAVSVEPPHLALGPISWEALYEWTAELPRDLRQEWARLTANALDPPAISEQLARLDALVVQEQASLAAADRADTKVGRDPTVREWPPSIASLLRLELQPASFDEEEMQHRWAVAKTIESMLARVADLRDAPTDRTPDAHSGPRGLDLDLLGQVLSMLALLRRLSDTRRSCASQNLASVETRVDDHMAVVHHALAYGDPIAVVVHLSAVLARKLGNDRDIESAVRATSDALDSVPHGAAELLLKARDAALLAAAGKHVDLGAVTLIAEPAVRIVEAIPTLTAFPATPGVEITSEREKHPES